MRKAPSRKFWLITVIGLAVAAVGILVVSNGKSSQAPPEKAPPEVAREIKPTNVVVRKMVTENVEEKFTLPGTLEAWENLTLSLEQAGPIRWVGPSEGDPVKAGEAILRIDSETLQSQHDRNRVDFDVKKKQLDRAESLLSEKLISERDFDEARKDFESARSTLEQTDIALRKTTLRSPIEGILDDLKVDRGEYGNIGMPAAVVVKVDRLKVIVDVPEKDVGAIRTGQKVMVLPAGIMGTDVRGQDGKIIHVSYQADEMTRTYPTRIEMDNSRGLLRPGMIVRVRFVRRILEDVLVVPLYSIIDRDGEKFLFVVENGSATERKVHLGPILNGSVVVHGGLQEGENLIVKGQQLVSDGGPVNIVEQQGKEG